MFILFRRILPEGKKTKGPENQFNSRTFSHKTSTDQPSPHHIPTTVLRVFLSAPTELLLWQTPSRTLRHRRDNNSFPYPRAPGLRFVDPRDLHLPPGGLSDRRSHGDSSPPPPSGPPVRVGSRHCGV